MKMYPRNSGEKRRYDDMDMDEEEALGSLCRLGDSSHHSSGADGKDEKRMRREIANSNERRRMQSINAGFSSLKALLPNTTENEKLSKAAILQQTADYIRGLEHEKSGLFAQNKKLRSCLESHLPHLAAEIFAELNDPSTPLKAEIISTIEDLHHNSSSSPISSSNHPHKLLPNTQFRQQNKVRKLDVDHTDVNQKPKSYSTLIVEDPDEVFETKMPLGPIKTEDYNPSSPNQKVVQIKMDCDVEKKRRLTDRVKTLVCPPTKKHYIKEYLKEEFVMPDQQQHVEFETVSNISTSGTVLTKNRVFTSSNGHSKAFFPTSSTVKIMSSSSGNIVMSSGMKPHKRILADVGSNSAAVVSSNSPVNGVTSSSTVYHPQHGTFPKVEVEPASRIPTPEQMEYSSPHQQLSSAHSSPSHVMQHPHPEAGQNSAANNPSSQKSLDTICEAIRHLEGDLSFSSSTSAEETPAVLHTYEISSTEVAPEQEGEDNKFLSSQPHHTEEVESTNTPPERREAKVVYTFTSSSPSSPPTPPSSSSPPHATAVLRQQSSVQLHHQGGHSLIYGVGKHLISEPQEVPLELTTNHSHHPHRIHHTHPHLQRSTSSTTAFIHHHATSRPGVIVVKPS